MMAKEQISRIKGKVEVSYEWSFGKYAGEFFKQMKQGKLAGARCTKCKKVLVPPAAVCGACFADTEDELIPLPDIGEVISYTRIDFKYPGQIMEPPYAVGIIRIDGANARFNHMIKAHDLEKLECGSKVKIHWREENERKGSFYDIEYFELLEDQ